MSVKFVETSVGAVDGPLITRIQRQITRAVEKLDDQAQALSFVPRIVAGGEQLGRSPLVVYRGSVAASVILPPARFDLGAGLMIIVINAGAGTLTVRASGGDTILGSGTSKAVASNTATWFASDGASSWGAN